LKTGVEAVGGKRVNLGGVTVLGNSEAVQDVQDMRSAKADDVKEKDIDKRDVALEEKPTILNGDHAFAKNLKKMFPETGSTASNGARPKEARATHVVGKKEKQENDRRKAQTPEDKENLEEDLMLSPKLLAALAGPNGDQETIIRIMKANGINAKVPEEKSRQDVEEETPHQKLRRGVEAIGGKMVSLGGMTVLGNSEAVQDVQNLVSAGGVTVLGQAGAVDNFMSTVGGITVLGNPGAIDRSALRAGSREDADAKAPNSPFLENGDPRPGRPDDKKICWHCQTPDGKFSAMAEKLITLSKCRGCRKAWYCMDKCQNGNWVRHEDYCKFVMKKRKEKKKKQAENITTK